MNRKEKQRAYYLANQEKWKAYKIAWNTKYPERVLFQSAKSRAKKNGLAFTITLEDVVIPLRCPIFGYPLVVDWKVDGPRRCRYNSPSLDRINSALGYVKGNVQVISWRANDVKRNATSAELFIVAAFLKKQGM